MTASSLPTALRAGAQGLYALEAATGLIIAHGTWLARDFACFIYHGAGTAAIDWEAAIGALDGGELPSSGGERRILRLAASLAGQAPVSLGEAVPGIDDRNVALLVKAILHASGQRQFPRLGGGVRDLRRADSPGELQGTAASTPRRASGPRP